MPPWHDLCHSDPVECNPAFSCGENLPLKGASIGRQTEETLVPVGSGQGKQALTDGAEKCEKLLSPKVAFSGKSSSKFLPSMLVKQAI